MARFGQVLRNGDNDYKSRNNARISGSAKIIFFGFGRKDGNFMIIILFEDFYIKNLLGEIWELYFIKNTPIHYIIEIKGEMDHFSFI